MGDWQQRWQHFRGWLFNGEPCFDYSRNHWVGAIYLSGLAVTLIVALILGSEERQESWYWPTIGFLLILVSMGLQILRERALTERTQKAERESAQIQAEYAKKQEELNKRQQDLIEYLHTMPPPYAMDSLTESYDTVMKLWRAELREPSAIPKDPKYLLSEYQKAVRICLNAMARLYLQYEQKPLNCRCTAHFAEYIPIEEIRKKPKLESRVSKGLRFVERRNDPLYGLIGVLWVRPDMSAISEPGNEDSWDPDPHLKRDLYLPIPDGPFYDDAKRTRFLPIAPQAFELGMVAAPNIETGIKWDALNISPSVKDEAWEYLSGDEDGQLGSVVGYSLLWRALSPAAEKDSDDGYGDIRLGVLTLFTDTPNSKDENKLDTFFKVLRPLLELQKEFIVAMMAMRDQISRNGAGAESSEGD